MTCKLCGGTGVVTEVLSTVGEPPDYEPVDCQCVKGAEVTVDDLRVGHDWRAEPPVRQRRKNEKRTVTLAVTVEVYDEGEGWDVAYAVAGRVQEALKKAASTATVYGAEANVITWEE